ncbi:unknown [Prevotella sp. CAG:873]|nr:unknown [Prevotella sp. CAG:873]
MCRRHWRGCTAVRLCLHRATHHRPWLWRWLWPTARVRKKSRYTDARRRGTRRRRRIFRRCRCPRRPQAPVRTRATDAPWRRRPWLWRYSLAASVHTLPSRVRDRWRGLLWSGRPKARCMPSWLRGCRRPGLCGMSNVCGCARWSFPR